MSARKSSRSLFTLPQLRQSRRRTSSSSRIRQPPLDRSRTWRTRRSYQPFCTRPQQPQTVFLSADAGSRCARPARRTRRARTRPDESLQIDIRPRGAAAVSDSGPSLSVARIRADQNPESSISTSFSPSPPPKITHSIPGRGHLHSVGCVADAADILGNAENSTTSPAPLLP